MIYALQELPGSIVLGFLKVDAQPMKQAMSTLISKFIYSITVYIQGRVRICLQTHPIATAFWRFLCKSSSHLTVAYLGM